MTTRRRLSGLLVFLSAVLGGVAAFNGGAGRFQSGFAASDAADIIINAYHRPAVRGRLSKRIAGFWIAALGSRAVNVHLDAVHCPPIAHPKATYAAAPQARCSGCEEDVQKYDSWLVILKIWSMAGPRAAELVESGAWV